jgi:hypothetical protein
MPNLTVLARENLSFSDTDLLGGFHNPSGTICTMGALLATTSGVPFSLEVYGSESQNSMVRYESFAPGLTTLGDVLAEKGSCVDKEVCRCPEGIIYMHNIVGMTKLLSESFAEPRHGCVGRPVFRGKRRFFSNAAHRETAVCVIVYGQYLQGEKNRESFVVLHHYFTNRVHKGLPLLQIYFAVRRLRQFIKYRNRS